MTTTNSSPLGFAVVAAFASLAAPSARAADAPPESADGILPWLGEHWTADGWGANGSARYMRALDDAGWRARMLALQAVAQAGDKAVPSLLAALKDHERPTESRIFAAQALGFVPEKSAREPLLAALSRDPSDAVRLYAADAIGMQGLGEALALELEQLRGKERNRDAKKHIGYVLGRGAEGIDSDVIKRLAEWDASKINTAKLGDAAPDFELGAITGETVRLSDFRGKSAVVLVFIYGDT